VGGGAGGWGWLLLVVGFELDGGLYMKESDFWFLISDEVL
jgi:hypothetical protein